MTSPWWSAILPLSSVLVLGGIALVLPRWSPDTVPLGVRVPSARVDDPVVRAALRCYLRGVSALTAVCAVVVAALGAWTATFDAATRSGSFAAVNVGATLLMALAIGVVAARCGAPIRRAKTEQGWYDGVRVGLVASLTPGGPSARVPWPWYAAALAILAATAAYGVAGYDALPAMIVTHSGVDGPDQWAPKGFWPVFGPLLIGVGLVVMMLAIAVPAARRPLPALPEGDIERARTIARAKARVLQRILGMMAVVLAVTIALVCVGMWHDAGWTTAVAVVLAVLSTPAILIMYMLDPDASATLPRTAHDPDSPDDDACWRWWGYVNPADPRLMVEKRMGLGWTVNFGHPAGKAIGVALLLLLVGGLALPLVLH